MAGWFSRMFKGGGDGPGDGAGAGDGPPRWWEGEFPAWAEPLKTQDRLTAFIGAIERYFSKRRIALRVHPDGFVIMPESGVFSGQYGLSNLLQTCAQRGEQDWNGLVAAHFDALARSNAQNQEYDAKVRDWAFAGPRLRVRLWETGELPAMPEMVTSVDIEGLTTALVVDLPEAIRSIRDDEVAAWGKPVAEVFRVARENVFGEVRPEVVPLDPDEPGGLLIIDADSFYTASVALAPESVPGLLGEHGVFLSMPVRHGLLAWRFNELDDVQGIGALVRATRRLFDDGPGSISDRVWWFHEGMWWPIGYESGPEHVAVIPPPELMEYLNGLAGGDALE